MPRPSDIQTWLAGLGLEKYGAAFAAGEINAGTLPHLTEDDLKGARPARWPRRKILAAIVTLADGDATEPILLKSQEQTPHKTTPERRQLTVMFADLTDSVPLFFWPSSGPLNPEAAAALRSPTPRRRAAERRWRRAPSPHV